ncbi:hypothetical protein FB451DRAFT_1191914 [Mycena latifolia]|nr:hypothetical protein FB451DRAFT_1191914 [Mycena latifolia]
MPREPEFLGTPNLSSRNKCWRHADAQRRYVDRNLAAVRAQAWIRMEDRHAETKRSAAATKAVRGHRREIDADYRERKFIAKFGRRAYTKHYAPLYKTEGNGRHLPGIIFAVDDASG